LAHITGGGLLDNLPRILPDGLGARLLKAAWQVPPIFELIAEQGEVPPDEMRRVFNMGVGMVAVVPPGQATVAVEALTAEGAALIGEVVAGEGVRVV
jgi:phosphoribosylformylglycinamidine cyclo-ligase